LKKPVKRPYEAPLRKKQADSTRGQILEAAALVFAEKGYGSARIEDVAAAAGVAVPTVYKVFGSKTALLLEAVEFLMADSGLGAVEEQPWWQEQVNERDPARQLGLIGRNARNIYSRAGVLLDVMRSAAGGDAAVAEALHRVEAERLKRSQLTAQSLAARGALKDGIDADAAATTLWVLSGAEVYTVFLRRAGATPDLYGEWLSRTFRDALLR
jgi:AcrR family transcriptional regulator